MDASDFFIRYANTPIADREKEIDAGPSGKFTLAEIYKQVETLQDYLRGYQTQQQNLIDIADKYMPKL